MSYERLVELCRQEPHELETRLRAATAEAIRSIMSMQGSSVAQLPRAFGDIEHPLEPLPLLNWQNTDFWWRLWLGEDHQGSCLLAEASDVAVGQVLPSRSAADRHDEATSV